MSRKGNPSRHINRNVAVMASAASRLLRAYTTYPAMMDESRNVRIDQIPAAHRDRLASQLLTACGVEPGTLLRVSELMAVSAWRERPPWS